MLGYQNEYAFVLALNNKTKKELNPLLNDLIYYLFGNIDDNTMIKAWRNHEKQKTDVFIKVDGLMKGISIKLGSRNSVHTERLSTFVKFLKEIGLDNDVINIYLKYHYGDGSVTGKGDNRMSVEEVKEKYKKAIIIFNNKVNNEEIVMKAIERFILKGTNSDFKINAIVHGTPEDFLWISEQNIIKVIMKNINKFSSSIHFSSLYVQPITRCLNYNSKYEDSRNIVQIKWYSLEDDIIEYMNDYKMEKVFRSSS